MSKIILNPEDGAPIRNVQIKGQILFKDSPFEQDSLRKLDNDSQAEDLLSLFGFLQELTADQAKQYIEDKKKRAFRCDKCAFATNVEIALKGHQRKHEAEDRLTDELGIEVVSDVSQVPLTPEELEARREEAEKKHLEAGGITAKWEDETMMRGASM